MYLFLPGIQNLLWDILEKNNIKFVNDEKWAFSWTPSVAPFCSAVCDWHVSPQHLQFKGRHQSASYSARRGRQHRSTSHGFESTVSILFHFLLRVASTSFSIYFRSPAVPDFTPGQESNQDRCPGWNDLLQRKSWILPQRHLLGSQPVRRSRVSFVRSEHKFRNARAVRISRTFACGCSRQLQTLVLSGC